MQQCNAPLSQDLAHVVDGRSQDPLGLRSTLGHELGELGQLGDLVHARQRLQHLGALALQTGREVAALVLGQIFQVRDRLVDDLLRLGERVLGRALGGRDVFELLVGLVDDLGGQLSSDECTRTSLPSGPIVSFSEVSCFSKLLDRSGSLSRNCTRVNNLYTLVFPTHRPRLRLRPLPRVRAGILRQLLRLLKALLHKARRVGERGRVEALGRELA